MTDSNDQKKIASYGELTEYPKMVFIITGSAGGELE